MPLLVMCCLKSLAVKRNLFLELDINLYTLVTFILGSVLASRREQNRFCSRASPHFSLKDMVILIHFARDSVIHGLATASICHKDIFSARKDYF